MISGCAGLAFFTVGVVELFVHSGDGERGFSFLPQWPRTKAGGLVSGSGVAYDVVPSSSSGTITYASCGHPWALGGTLKIRTARVLGEAKCMKPSGGD